MSTISQNETNFLVEEILINKYVYYVKNPLVKENHRMRKRFNYSLFNTKIHKNNFCTLIFKKNKTGQTLNGENNMAGEIQRTSQKNERTQ